MNNPFFFERQKFKSYQEFEEQLEAYENHEKYRFIIKNSKTLYQVFNDRSDLSYNPNLIYNEMYFHCSSINDKTRKRKKPCQAILNVRISPKKQNLEIDKLVNVHNHEPPTSLLKRRKRDLTTFLEKARQLKNSKKYVMKDLSNEISPIASNAQSSKNLSSTSNKDVLEFFLNWAKVGAARKDNILNKIKKISLLDLTLIDQRNLHDSIISMNLHEFAEYFETNALQFLELIVVSKKNQSTQ